MPGWNGSASSSEEMAWWPHTTGQGLTQKSFLRSGNHFNASPSMGIQATRWAWRKGKHDPKGQLTLPQREQLHPHCPQARRQAPASYWNTRATSATGDQLEVLFPDWQVPGTQWRVAGGPADKTTRKVLETTICFKRERDYHTTISLKNQNQTDPWLWSQTLRMPFLKV